MRSHVEPRTRRDVMRCPEAGSGCDGDNILVTTGNSVPDKLSLRQGSVEPNTRRQLRKRVFSPRLAENPQGLPKRMQVSILIRRKVPLASILRSHGFRVLWDVGVVHNMRPVNRVDRRHPVV